MIENRQVIRDVLDVFNRHGGGEGDRMHNLKLASLILGGAFAILAQHANRNDCIEIAREAQTKLGWFQ